MAPYRNHVEQRASRKPVRQYVSETHDHRPTKPRYNLSREQRKALADAYAARGRKGLHKTRAGWQDPDRGGIEYYSSGTILSLVRRGYLDLWAKDTVAHVTDYGADVHEELREAGL